MNSRAKKILLLAAAAALLCANGFMLPFLNRERGALGITRIEPLENAPPMLALTTQVLGGFRGLIANALWIRASQLQDEGKYFEMVQLADWITKLEPHIVQVWNVQAWNMAFNISVKFPDHSDRWRWVQRGIELLRDEALRYNPNQPLLYADLEWMFQFKMGANLDDAHLYYKFAWAKEMMDVFGGERPDFERLANPQTPDEQRRAQLLRQRYKMDAVSMRQIDQSYGPLDWRLPEAHAIYWASIGMARVKKEEDIRRLRWGIYQSMNLSYQRGVLVLSSNAPPRFFPNLAIIPKVDAAYREQLAEAAQTTTFLTNNMARAYKNWLRDVPYQFFIVNRLREGETWLRYLRERFPDATPPNLTLAEYSVERAMETVSGTSQNRITQLLYGFVQQSYDALIDGNEDDANAYMQRAKEAWKAYNERTKDSQRTRVPTIPEIQKYVVTAMLSPNSRLSPDQKARLRAAAPNAAQGVPETPAGNK
jgi:hypothetical protein